MTFQPFFKPLFIFESKTKVLSSATEIGKLLLDQLM